MVRSFDGTPVDLDWLEGLCEDALRAPTAGNTAGVYMYTVGAADVATYMSLSTDETWRKAANRAPGLARAGGVVLITSSPKLYAERYREDDKANSGLGDLSMWPRPYWHADAAMATMALLLLLEEANWQATLWGSFRRTSDVLPWIGAGPDEELFGAVLVGRSDGHGVRSRSLERNVPTRKQRVRRVRT